MDEEQFDIFDEHWIRIGTASRSDAHRLGLRHRTFHCWIIRSSGGKAYARFQKRRESKDTYPGFWDITAAGHLAAGESVRDAMREIHEELGIEASFSELIPLGHHEERAIGTANGMPFIDHERSEEFALRCEVPLLAHRLQEEEVAGIYEAGLDELILLFEGRIQELSVHGAEWPGINAAYGHSPAYSAASDSELPPAPDRASSGLVPVIRTVRADEFVPRSSGYYVSLFRKLRELA